MYNDTYHPLEGERLKDVLFGLTEEEARIARDQVEAATVAKIRNYRGHISQNSQRDKHGGPLIVFHR